MTGRQADTHAPPSTLKVAVDRGAAAAKLLADGGFVAEWEGLADRCPWSTTFQRHAFAVTWYEVYASRYEPLLVYAMDDAGRLVGLLPLAVERGSGEVVHAGTHHAEYHAWLAPTDDGGTFLISALEQLRRMRLAGRLLFLFLAPGAPLDWRTEASRRGIHGIVRWHQRGLMRTSGDPDVTSPFRKSGNRSRLNRLRRLGPVRLEQLTCASDLEKVIDEIAAQCDVRQGAVHGSLPFLSDPLKRTLYLRLLDQPGLMHATVLRAGDQVVASHIGVCNGAEVSLGLITHAPQLAAMSPGKLLLLHLGQLLGEQRFERFDLTPGGSYKDRFATEHDAVCVLEVFLDPIRLARYRTRRAVAGAVRNVDALTGHDLSGKVLRTTRRGLRLLGRSPMKNILTLGRVVHRWVGSAAEFRYYEWAVTSATPGDVDSRIRVNAIEDLLLYRPTEPSDPPLTNFLATAVKRLERGQILFTASDGERLLHYSWLIPSTSVMGSDYGHRIELTSPAAVLWDDFTHPAARGQGLHKASIISRLRYVAECACAERALIGVRADNVPSRHNIEKVGFTYSGSGWIAVRFGRKQRWSSPSLQQGSP